MLCSCLLELHRRIFRRVDTCTAPRASLSDMFVMWTYVCVCLRMFAVDSPTPFESMPPGERPDTVLCHNMPAKWFEVDLDAIPRDDDEALQTVAQGEQLFTRRSRLWKAFSVFGDIA